MSTETLKLIGPSDLEELDLLRTLIEVASSLGYGDALSKAANNHLRLLLLDS